MDFAGEEDKFFEEASSLIYKELSEEERMQLQMELLEENIAYVGELKPKWRFFRLLRFIQVGYARVQRWASGIREILREINSNKSEVFIDEVVEL